MGITKDDVIKALASIEDGLEKADGSKKGKSGSVPTDGDLNDANGAADGDSDLSVDDDNMNDKYGNKKATKSMDAEKGAKSMTGTKKSMPEDFSAGLPGEIETKVDVSNFLKSLVDHTADSHDKLRDFVVKSDMASESRYEELDGRVEEVQKSLANIGVVLKAICEQIGVIGNQSVVSKSQAVAQGKGVVERDIRKSDPEQENVMQAGETGGIYKSLSGRPPHIVKSLIADKLCDLVRKGEAKDVDVINFETYNHVSPELDEKLRHAFA